MKTRPLIMSMLLAVAFAFAQDFGGTYTERDNPKTVLTIRSLGGTEYEGTFSNDGAETFRLQGISQPDGLGGFIFLREAGYDQDLAFLATFREDLLELIVGFADAQGNVDQSTIQLLTFTRSRGETTTGTPTTLTPQTSSADSFAGRYSGQGLALELVAAQGGYRGSVSFQGQTYPLEALPSNAGLTGTFVANGSQFPFEVFRSGQGVSFNTGGQEYRLSLLHQAAADPAQPVAQPGVGNALQPGQRYSAGTVLSSPWAGITFTVPAGHVGAYDPTFGGFMMQGEAGDTLLYVEAAGEVQALTLAESVIDHVASVAQAELQPMSFPQQSGDTITATYLLGNAILHGSVRQGPAGNAFVVLAYGFQIEKLSELVQRVVAGAAFATPDPSGLDDPLPGNTLSSSGNDDINSPGINTGSFVSTASQTITFCQGRVYAFESRSVSFASVDGIDGSASMRDEESDAHHGNYLLTRSLMGELVVVLHASDGRSFARILSATDQGVFIDGRLHHVTPAQVC
ncbi:MAG: hypothetical protein JSV66_11315 [Trueperaceae bacterium]|nr:MAG: hypothetical protein JSV66_11315 [Trueperaceae bacterium]